MAGTLHSTRNALGIAERRIRTRTLIAPPIYVDLDNINGGLVFNISEDGLALTAALNLVGKDFLTMRIYLPDSKGWIEASGEIAWRGMSKKEGGVRFVGLADDARRRLSNWIAAEATHGEFHVEKEASARLPGLREEACERLRDWTFQEASRGKSVLARDEPHEKEERTLDVTTVHASSSSILESVKPALIVEKREQDSIVLVHSDTCQDGREGGVAKPILRYAQGRLGTLQDAGGAPEVAERRARVRAPIAPPIYVNLENAIGGLVFNMSEDGLALTAALNLPGDVPITMRVLIPDSRGWMEVRGQIAWGTESKKTAGICFVGLPEDSRQRISEWLAAEASGRELRLDAGTLPKREQQRSDDVPAEMPVAPLSLFLNSNTVAEKRMLEAILSTPSRLATPGMPDDTVPAATGALPREFSKRIESNPESRLAFRPVPSEEGAERLRRFAAAVILACVTPVFIGWVARSPAVKNEVIGFIARNKEHTKEPTALKKSLPAKMTTNASALRSESGDSQVHRFEPLAADRPANSSETRPAAVRPEVRGIEGPAAKPTAIGSLHRTESLSLKSRSSKLSERAVVAVPNPAVEGARSQAIESSPAQLMGNTATPATSLSASVPSGTSVADVKEKESPPPLKQASAPVAPMWSIAVSTDPYPSIRITPDNSSQRASHGRSLQIGRAISRVEPIYPEDAKQQGVVGTVKLHVVVGRDGAVQSVEPISGPALLAKAATSAVREWHYAQTLLGGQPVETEQDIVVKFGLVSPSISKN